MRDYAQVRPTLWTGETGRLLRGNANAQRVQFYLLTCSSSNMAGLFYLPLPLLCHDLGMPLEGALEGLRSLSEVDFAVYDEPTSYVWVLNAARESVGSNPSHADNRVLGIRRELERHAKCPFYDAFVERYAALFEDRPAPVAQPKTRARPKPLQRGSQGSANSGSGSGSGSGAELRESAGALSPHARARSTASPPGESETRSPDETLTATQLRGLFRSTWMRADRADPPMPAEDKLVELAERVTDTAAQRRVAPAELLTTTLERWAKGERNARELRAPVQCFAQAFGEVLDQTEGGVPRLSPSDALSRKGMEAMRAGDLDRYDAIQAELRALNGGGSHA
jgi:hypothetical protein